MDKSEKNQQSARPCRVRTWLDLLQDIYATYFFCKAVFYFVLILRYLHLQSKLENPTAHGLNESIISQQIQDQRQLIRSSGLLLAEVGSAGALGYMSGILIYLVFYVTIRVPNSLFINRFRNDSLILLHADQERSSKQLQLASEKYLKQLIMLNLRKLRAIARFDYLSLISSKESHRIIRDLNEQQSYLRDLLIDKTAIWPKKRCEKWKQEQTQFAARSIISIYTVTFLSGLANINITGLYSANLMAARGDKPNFLEILGIQEVNVVIVPYTEMLISPIVLLVFILKYRRMALQCIKEQLCQLIMQLAELSSCPAQQEAKADLLRTECSRRSLEIYLSLRLYMDELRSSAKLASLLASQYAVFGLVLVILISAIFPKSDSLEMRLLFILLTILVVMINFSFLLCATIQSGCSKVVQLAWSLIAHTTIRDRRILAEESSEATRALEQRQDESVAGGLRKLLEFYMFDHLGVSLINEQTAQLWRRLVVDIQKVHGYFRFTALGLFELNFSGILRLNFWFISVVFISLTYRS